MIMNSPRPRLALVRIAAATIALALFSPACAAAQEAEELIVASTAADGAIGDGHSSFGSLSGDGRFLVFTTGASNICGISSATDALVIKDLQLGAVTVVNRRRSGGLARSDQVPQISADGRFVAFCSEDPDLVDGDTNGNADVFVLDRVAGTIDLVSVDDSGKPARIGGSAPAISGDGRFVAFCANSWYPGENQRLQVFVRDRQQGTTLAVSRGPDGSPPNDFCGGSGPAISTDGNRVAYHAHASNLVPGDTNGQVDLFVHDRRLGRILRVNVPLGSEQDDAGIGIWPRAVMSGDGRCVVFHTTATGYVAGDTPGSDDLILREIDTGRTWPLTIAHGGERAPGDSHAPRISHDGRRVVFESNAVLAPGEPIGRFAYIYDRDAHAVARAYTGGGSADLGQLYAEISGDGRTVIFSFPLGLVPADDNDAFDIYLVTDRGWFPPPLPTGIARAEALMERPVLLAARR